MLEPRWTKLARDLVRYRGRALLAVVAIAVGVFAITAVLVAYTVLSRELTRGYRATMPASATLVLADRADDRLVTRIGRMPGVVAIEPRTTLRGRIRNGPGEAWTPLVLFVVQDFANLRVSRFDRETGTWPPGPADLLVERSGLPVIGGRIGRRVELSLSGGSRGAMDIAGTVHDPGQAPGWMDGVVNAYMSPAAAVRLGLTDPRRELRVALSNVDDRSAAEASARTLAGWLVAAGHKVERIEVPPPGEHPHQAQMNALLAIIGVFGVVALVLAGVLSGSTMSAILAQQVGQIGVMKAVGARTAQIVRLYIAMALILAIAALMLGMPAGVLAGEAGAAWAARTLNFALASRMPAGWIWPVAAGIGLAIPLSLALGPVRSGARVTVREAIADVGGAGDGDRLTTALAALPLPRTVTLGLANAVRRRGRLALTLGLLAASGAMVMTAANVARSWELTLDRAFEGRRYDLDVRLEKAADPGRLVAYADGVPGVAVVEAWPTAEAARIHAGELDVVTAYPGAVHGGLGIVAPPVGTALFRPPLVEGRSLRPGDGFTAVVNRRLLADEPDLAVGGPVALRVAGRATRWRIVGLIDEPGAPPTVYVAPGALAMATGTVSATGLRIRLASRDADAEGLAAVAIGRALEDGGLPLASLQRTTVTRSSFDRHIAILVSALLVMGALIALVGGLGLASTLGINVAERTREFGVMQAVGARPRDIFHVIESEAVTVGALSWILALLLSVPLTHALAHAGGHVGIGRSLDIAFAPAGIAGWLAAVLLLSIAAGGPSAYRAARLTVKEILGYA